MPYSHLSTPLPPCILSCSQNTSKLSTPQEFAYNNTAIDGGTPNTMMSWIGAASYQNEALVGKTLICKGTVETGLMY